MKILTILQAFWQNKVLPALLKLDAKHRFIYGFCAVVLVLWLVKLVTFSGEQVPTLPQSPTAMMEEVPDSVQVDKEENTETVEPQEKQVQPSEEVKGEPVMVDAEKNRQVAARRKKPEGWPYYHRPIRSWREVEFDDKQDVQIVAAMKNGLKKPIRDRQMAEDEALKGELVFIGANPLYYVEDLKHSVPFLVPKAHRLLNRISLNFVDSLVSKGLAPHALLVTSVLRTQSDVNKLQRNNGNATENSAHQYATTFDISWRSFVEIGMDPNGSKHDMAQEIALKNALGEVLRDLRYENRCYVKHEVKQPCFHITVR